MPSDTAPPDPYRAYPFRLKWDGVAVAGVSRIDVLASGAQADGEQRRRVAGQTGAAPLTLERGIGHDAAFLAWASRLLVHENGPLGVPDRVMTPIEFRRDTVIERCDAAGQPTLAYTVHRCWASEINLLPALDGGTTAIVSLTLQHDGWERVPAAPAPG